jgi:hypothetical protein
MRTLRFLVPAALVALATTAATRADDQNVVVPGDPPLTRDVLDDYCKLAEWRFGPVLAAAGGADRLRQMVINDWKNGDTTRQKAVLADVRWWREVYPKLDPAERDRLAARPSPPGADPGQARQFARDAEAIRLLKLQQWNDARNLQIRAISNAQARHHETMMHIINNMRPTGRYEYNPATGRYDRYVR